MASSMIINPTDRLVLTDTKLQELLESVSGSSSSGDCNVTINNIGGIMSGTNATATGGVAIGIEAEAAYGGAIGSDAKTTDGGSIGSSAESYKGGAIGSLAITGDGFAGGYNAQTIKDNEYIDAIQLGEGTNSTERTFQVYEFQLMDENGEIPDDRIPGIIERLNALEYESVTISSMAVSPSTIEKGVTTTIKITWTLSGGSGDITVVLNGTALDEVNATSATKQISSTTTFTLQASDGTSDATSVSKTVNAYNYIYYGLSEEPSSITSSFVTGLSNKTLAKSASFVIEADENEYMYLAWPTGNGSVSITFGGIDAGFVAIAEDLSVTSTAGSVAAYDVYRSGLAGSSTEGQKVSVAVAT